MKKLFLFMALLTAALISASACSYTQNPLDKDTILIGVRDDTPGFAFNNGSGTVVGFEVDLAASIADALGKQAEFIVINDQNRELHLNSGTVDMVIAAYTITDSRKKSMHFTQPYYTDNLVFTAAPGSAYDAPADLAGGKIAVVDSTTAQSSIDSVLANEGISADVVTYNSMRDAVTALKNGEADALFMDASITRGYMGAEGKTLAGKYEPQGYGIAIRKSDTDFVKAIDDLLTEMKNNGQLDELMARWELST